MKLKKDAGVNSFILNNDDTFNQ